jgi:hypothetical protein
MCRDWGTFGSPFSSQTEGDGYWRPGGALDAGYAGSSRFGI